LLGEIDRTGLVEPIKKGTNLGLGSGELVFFSYIEYLGLEVVNVLKALLSLPAEQLFIGRRRLDDVRRNASIREDRFNQPHNREPTRCSRLYARRHKQIGGNVTKKVRVFQATKHVGIGTIRAGFDVIGYNTVNRCAPILRGYCRFAGGMSLEDWLETLRGHGFRVVELGGVFEEGVILD
jgi:hypothetical protein